jgi:hypothetical protein
VLNTKCALGILGHASRKDECPVRVRVGARCLAVSRKIGNMLAFLRETRDQLKTARYQSGPC